MEEAGGVGMKTRRKGKDPTLQERERISQISFPIIPYSLRYDGLNLMHWSQYIELILNGCGLKDHLTKTINPKDPGYQIWKKEDSPVHAWLLGSTAGERLKKFMFLKTAKGIWDHVHKSSSTRGIYWRVYCLVVRDTNLVQGNKTMEEYATDLTAN